jgi:hypothetical protein
VPGNIRGRYWSTDQMLAATAAVGILLLGALLFAVLPVYPAFALQYLIAVFGAWMSWRFLNRLPDVERPKIMNLEKIVAETPRLMMEPSAFRTYLWMAVVLFIATTPLIPFGTYYLRGTAGLGGTEIMLYMMLYYLGVIGANWFMRSRMDRVGAKPFFRISFMIYTLTGIGWLFCLHTNRYAALLLPTLFVALGAAAGCWTSANLNYLAKLLPQNDRALPLSVHGAVISFLGGVSPVVWGLFLKGSGEVPSINIPVFEAYFVVVVVSSIVLFWLVRRLQDQAGHVEPLIDGSWVLRPFRMVTDLINLVDRPPNKKDEKE